MKRKRKGNDVVVSSVGTMMISFGNKKEINVTVIESTLDKRKVSLIINIVSFDELLFIFF